MEEKFPEYVYEMIDGAKARLLNLKNENTVSFAFIPDTHHCTELTERALFAIREISKTVPISFTCLGGDYLCNNSNTTREMALAQHGDLRRLLDVYQQEPPVMVVVGNHDDNPFGLPENRLMPNEIYDVLMKHHPSLFVCDQQAPKSMYGYYDVPSAKLRAIFLNPMNGPYKNDNGKVTVLCGSAFGSRQLQWLADEALKMPGEGWSVALFAHYSPISAPNHLGERTFGGDAMWEVLNAYRNGSSFSGSGKRGELEYSVSCDFTKQGPGEVVGYFCGHYHYDWVWKVNTMPIVATLAAASDNFGTEVCSDGTVHGKTRGSGEESAFSIFTLDRAKRRLFCVRCGAGPDFNLQY